MRMNARHFGRNSMFFALCVAGALGGACSDPPQRFGNSPFQDGGSEGPNGVGPGGDDAGSTGTGGDVGLPCDLRDLLQSKCVECHGATPTQGATTSLVTYDDLMKASPTHPSENEAQVSLARMTNAAPAMPPLPATATSADVATLKNWIDAGTPHGTCSTSTGTLSDGGTIVIPDAGDDYDTPTVCTSGTTWTLGETKSNDMEPGLECHTCHVVGGKASGKEFDMSGTVYPTAHEPDLCNGVGGATVVITDKNGNQTSLSVNEVGNFWHDDAVGFLKIATPYTAVVKVGGKTRAMVTPQTDGNCNHCHTEAGTESAPGRVMMP